MKDDKPIPRYVEGKKEVERVGRVKNAGLKCCEKGDARIVKGVPEGQLKRLDHGYPQVFRRDEKRCKIALDKDVL